MGWGEPGAMVRLAEWGKPGAMVSLAESGSTDLAAAQLCRIIFFVPGVTNGICSLLF